MAFYKKTGNGFEIHIRATPNAKQEGVMGVELRDDGNEYLKIKTRAIPEDGKANEAIIKLLSKILKIPKSTIEITAGITSRNKVFLIPEISEDSLKTIISE